MTHFLHTQADLEAALPLLILKDPQLKPAAEKAGIFALRRREAGFAGLCAIVCGQQLSTASAQRGWKTQPDGGLIGLGTSPRTGWKARPASTIGSGIGTAPRRARV